MMYVFRKATRFLKFSSDLDDSELSKEVAKYLNKEDKDTKRKVPYFALGVLLFLVIAVLFPFRSQLFGILYPKVPSHAAECSGVSLQSKINSAVSGGMVTMDPCIYREKVTINKPLTLQGQVGSEIRGSDIWTSWTQSGSTFVSSLSVPSLPAITDTNACLSGLCKMPEQVFYDGNELTQVPSNPGQGQFSLDNLRHIVLNSGNNPNGHLVEVTTRDRGIEIQATNVTIKGASIVNKLVVKHVSPGYQRGAINVFGQGNSWNNTNIENCDISYSHTAGIALYYGESHIVRNCYIHHNGSNGLDTGANFDWNSSVAPTQGLLIEDNEIAFNNTQSYNGGWHAGGIKTTMRSGTASKPHIYQRNLIHDNIS